MLFFFLRGCNGLPCGFLQAYKFFGHIFVRKLLRQKLGFLAIKLKLQNLLLSAIIIASYLTCDKVTKRREKVSFFQNGGKVRRERKGCEAKQTHCFVEKEWWPQKATKRQQWRPVTVVSMLLVPISVMCCL